MREEEIPDLNLFMMCERLNRSALSHLPEGYTFRTCTAADIPTLKAFPFDTPELVKEYDGFMSQFFGDTYAENLDVYLGTTWVACDRFGLPVATCARWKAYGKFQTVHWFKTLKTHEGLGLGRAVLSQVMLGFREDDYPIFLHTQPGSYRAVKVYSDFGFALLKGEGFGTRTNDCEKCLPILKEFMPSADFARLKIVDPPRFFVDAMREETRIHF